MKLKYKPSYATEREITAAISELKGDIRFHRFQEALYNMREAALGRMYHDTVLSDERLSLCYQIESRVYSDILNMIEEAKGVPMKQEESA